VARDRAAFAKTLREWPMREIVNGIFYVMRAGCAGGLGGLDALAVDDCSRGAGVERPDLPPWGTLYRPLIFLPAP